VARALTLEQLVRTFVAPGIRTCSWVFIPPMPPAYVLCWKEALLPFLLDTNQILAIEPMRHGDQCGDPALPGGVAGGIKKQTACAASESLCPNRSVRLCSSAFCGAGGKTAENTRRSRFPPVM